MAHLAGGGRQLPRGLNEVRALDRTRRRALGALCALALCLPAAAQDPRSSEAVAASRDWLVIVDGGNARRMYEMAGKRFRDGITPEQWEVVSARARSEFGAVRQRTLVSALAPPPGSNAPPGEFLTIVFRSQFDKRDVGLETLTMEREPDGKWRVIGYLIR
jgi:hypothetical protein